MVRPIVMENSFHYGSKIPSEVPSTFALSRFLSYNATISSQMNSFGFTTPQLPVYHMSFGRNLSSTSREFLCSLTSLCCLSWIIQNTRRLLGSLWCFCSTIWSLSLCSTTITSATLSLLASSLSIFSLGQCLVKSIQTISMPKIEQ